MIIEDIILEVIDKVNREIRAEESLNMYDYRSELLSHICYVNDYSTYDNKDLELYYAALHFQNLNLYEDITREYKGELDQVPVCIFDNDFLNRFGYKCYLDILKSKAIDLFKPFYDSINDVDGLNRNAYFDRFVKIILERGNRFHLAVNDIFSKGCLDLLDDDTYLKIDILVLNEIAWSVFSNKELELLDRKRLNKLVSNERFSKKMVPRLEVLINNFKDYEVFTICDSADYFQRVEDDSLRRLYDLVHNNRILKNYWFTAEKSFLGRFNDLQLLTIDKEILDFFRYNGLGEKTLKKGTKLVARKLKERNKLVSKIKKNIFNIYSSEHIAIERFIKHTRENVLNQIDLHDEEEAFIRTEKIFREFLEDVFLKKGNSTLFDKLSSSSLEKFSSFMIRANRLDFTEFLFSLYTGIYFDNFELIFDYVDKYGFFSASQYLCLFDNRLVSMFYENTYIDICSKKPAITKTLYDNTRNIDERFRDEYLERVGVFLSRFDVDDFRCDINKILPSFMKLSEEQLAEAPLGNLELFQYLDVDSCEDKERFNELFLKENKDTIKILFNLDINFIFSHFDDEELQNLISDIFNFRFLSNNDTTKRILKLYRKNKLICRYAFAMSESFLNKFSDYTIANMRKRDFDRIEEKMRYDEFYNGEGFVKYKKLIKKYYNS